MVGVGECMSGTITMSGTINEIGGGEKIEQVGVRSDRNPTKKDVNTRCARMGEGVGDDKRLP